MGNLRRQLLFGLVTSTRFEALLRSVPLGERTAYGAARRYVAGTTREDALAVARSLARRGVASSLDYFGESVGEQGAAEAATAAYVELAGAIRALQGVDAYVSIDLSHVGLDISEGFCRAQVEVIAEALPRRARLQVGAEESRRTDRILAVTKAVARSGGRVMATLQANLRRSEADAAALVAAGIPVRLVKGAYVEPPHLAHQWGKETDAAYRLLAHRLHSAGADFTLATHDASLQERLFAELGRLPVEMLLGVCTSDATSLVGRGHHVRLYVPYGGAWFRYWMRRVASRRRLTRRPPSLCLGKMEAHLSSARSRCRLRMAATGSSSELDAARYGSSMQSAAPSGSATGGANRRRALVVALAATVLAACVSSDGETSVAPAATSEACTSGSWERARQITVTVGEQARSALLHVPDSVNSSAAPPVVIAFHGFGGGAIAMETASGLSTKAEEEGFIAVYPEGTGHTPGWDLVGDDDVAFVEGLLTTLEADLCFDRRRVYATGISMGAGMANAVGCRLSDRIAAIASVSGAYLPPESAPCTPSRPLPVIAFHGKQDEVLPYDGGAAPGKYPRVIAVEAWAAAWAAHNECAEGPDREPVSTETVQRLVWTGCRAPVELYAIENRGHTWPGSPLDASPDTAGDISATDVVWDFLAGHALAPADTP